MAKTISNIKEIENSLVRSNTKTLSFTEEYQKINQVKYNLGIAYFVALSVLMTTLFI